MNFTLHQDHRPRLPVMALAVLAAIYLLAGVLGHDPWKGEDAIHLAIAHGFWQDGQWLLPRIAGEPWLHTTPLYHWVAASLGGLLQFALPFHEGARLASPLFGLVLLAALAAAARSFHGEAESRLAPILAIGTIGLLVNLHEAQPAVAGLACAAIAWWGGGLILTGKPRGAALLGLGLGLACATNGLVGFLAAVTVVLAPIFRRDWKALAIALAIAIPLALAWPLALLQTSPEAIASWWWNEWAEATLGRRVPTENHVEIIAWATWPILPLSLWGMHVLRRERQKLGILLMGLLVGLLWYFTGPARSLGLFPLLIPLTLLATAGIGRLRRGAANAFDWFSAITFSLVAALIWLGASALALGWPAPIARNFAKLAPGDSGGISLVALLVAILATVGWLIAWRLPRAPWRSGLRWAAGVTMMWVLVTSLWMNWIDHYKSYRPVVSSLRQALPADIDCLERANLGATQRAMLDYYAGIRTVSPASQRCRYRLSESDMHRPTPEHWETLWQGNRPSDRKQRWYLDRRVD